LEIFYFQEPELTLTDVNSILEYYEYYCLEDELRDHCLKILSSNINANNWFKMFQLGVKLNSDEIKDRSMKLKPSTIDDSFFAQLTEILSENEKHFEHIEKLSRYIQILNTDNEKQSHEIQKITTDNKNQLLVIEKQSNDQQVIFQRLEKLENK